MRITSRSPYTVYHITNTLEFLLVDLQKYLTGKRTVKECRHCAKLFFPVQRSSAKYCKIPFKATGKTCDYIMHHTPKDELEKLFNTAKRQQAKKRDYITNVDTYGYEFLEKIYQEWKDELEIQYAKARRTNNINDFKNWIEKTKFKKQRLEELKKSTEKAVTP